MLVTSHDFALNGLMRCDMLFANPASSYSREEDHGDRKHHAEEEREWNVCVVALSPKQAIATEDAPEEARKRFPGPEILGDAFVLVAERAWSQAEKPSSTATASWSSRIKPRPRQALPGRASKLP